MGQTTISCPMRPLSACLGGRAIDVFCKMPPHTVAAGTWCRIPKGQVWQSQIPPKFVHVLWWFKMACDRIGSLRVTRVTAYRQRLKQSPRLQHQHQRTASDHDFVCDSSLSFTNRRLAHSSSLYITLKIVPTPYCTFCLLPSIPRTSPSASLLLL